MGIFDAFTALVGTRPVVSLDSTPAAGDAETALRALIKEVRAEIEIERRAGGTRTLDCLITPEVIEACGELLTRHLGEPIKPFGKKVKFDDALQALIDSKGGIAKNQCLFLRQFEDGRILYAALWPWVGGVDITLKIGTYDETL